MARTRDRHGRGLRGDLAPRDVPISQGPAQTFDAAVLDAVEHLEAHGVQELAGIEFAVEDVPDPVGPALFASPDARPGLADQGAVYPELVDDDDLLDDAGVPLARAYPRGLGDVHSPVVVLYRRPLESRAVDPDDLADLVHEVVLDRVAHLLGRDPADLDPHAED